MSKPNLRKFWGLPLYLEFCGCLSIGFSFGMPNMYLYVFIAQISCSFYTLSFPSSSAPTLEDARHGVAGGGGSNVFPEQDLAF